MPDLLLVRFHIPIRLSMALASMTWQGFLQSRDEPRSTGAFEGLLLALDDVDDGNWMHFPDSVGTQLVMKLQHRQS